MDRWIAVVVLAVGSSVFAAERGFSYNALWIESKTVLPGATGVTIGVWVVNDTPLTALLLPLEFRDTDGNGSYISGSCTFNIPAGNRIGASPLTGLVTKRILGTPVPEGQSCPTNSSTYHYCSDSRLISYSANGPVDFTSPDGFMWAGVSTNAPPDLYMLPPGSDSVTGAHRGWPLEGDSTTYPAGASFEFVFNVNAVPGTFEIDTMCVCPGSTLLGTDMSVDRLRFAFRKGVITISAVPNGPPLMAGISSKTMHEGDTLIFAVSANDPDGTPPFLSAEGLPANATLTDSGNGVATFRFTPWFTQAGIYDVLFVAWDGELADSELVAMSVTNVGDPPVLAPINSKSVDEGQQLVFRVSATDIDGTTPALRMENPPLHATLVDSGNGSGAFDFQPDFTQAGVYQVRFIASDSLSADSETVAITVGGATSVRSVETGGDVPTTYTLEQNYPNPFNAATVIRFRVPRDGQVRLEVFNILGRKVKTLHNGFETLGAYAVDWDGTDDHGTPLSSGVYFYRLQAGDYSKTRSMLLLK